MLQTKEVQVGFCRLSLLLRGVGSAFSIIGSQHPWY
jgi:hypothetical protein